MTKLQKKYNLICEEYIAKFVKNQGYEFSYWTANEVGSIACFIDQYFFNFDDIRFDIDNKCPKGLIFKWQDDGLEFHQETGDTSRINYKSYNMGLRYEHLNNINK